MVRDTLSDGLALSAERQNRVVPMVTRLVFLTNP